MAKFGLQKTDHRGYLMFILSPYLVDRLDFRWASFTCICYVPFQENEVLITITHDSVHSWRMSTGVMMNQMQLVLILL